MSLATDSTILANSCFFFNYHNLTSLSLPTLPRSGPFGVILTFFCFVIYIFCEDYSINFTQFQLISFSSLIFLVPFHILLAASLIKIYIQIVIYLLEP